MCLLHTHHPDTVLLFEDIEDYYSYNSDGLGVMYSEPDEAGVPRLIVKKFLPRDARDAFALYEEHIKGREALVHWRWATHGDVNLFNCHPYPVVPMDAEHPLYLMHNGILQCGNASDKSKSDTWHFIEEYLKPLFDPVTGAPIDVAFNEGFVHLLTKVAGYSNKLAMMDDLGRVALTDPNGWHAENGILYSNTYAWTPAGSHRYVNNGAFERGWDQDAHWSIGKAGSIVNATASTANTYPKPDALGNVIPIGARNSGSSSSSGREHTPMTAREKSTLDEFEDSFDDMYEVLDAARRKLSYRELEYIDMARFVQEVGLSALWHIVTKCETRQMLQKDFIYCVKHPVAFKAMADDETRERIAQMDEGEAVAAEEDAAWEQHLRETRAEDDGPEVLEPEVVAAPYTHYRSIDGMWYRRYAEEDAPWLPAPDYVPPVADMVQAEWERDQEVAEADADWASMFKSTDQGVVRNNVEGA